MSDTVAPNAPRLLTIEDAARALQIGRTQLYVEIKEGRLRTLKVGKRRCVSPDALAEWIKAREDEQNPHAATA